MLDNDMVYLDSASTSLKPSILAKATADYYNHSVSNIDRANNRLSINVSNHVEQSRSLVAKLINATSKDDIIWTSGATSSANLVAYAFGLTHFDAQSEIIVSELEHHSNLVPWIRVCELTSAKLIKWPACKDGTLNSEHLNHLISNKTKLIVVTQMSNVTGFMPDIDKITDIAHQHEIAVLVDGSQGIVHHPLDVQATDVDFYLFSAHKYYGPTGLGVLYAKAHLLESMSIWQGGGKMLTQCDFEQYSPAPFPAKYEAGTLNIAAILGFKTCLEFIMEYPPQNLAHYVAKLSEQLFDKIMLLAADDWVFLSERGSPILSFAHKTISAYDINLALSNQNIVVRDGKLCAHPLLAHYQIEHVIRVSLMPYNNEHDLNAFISALNSTLQLLD